ncbi:MAG: response regulator transcription factor [Anaerolineaceae bacterium]|nr:response regulator transcription factor [Anaerolineaceae bacterium]
MNKEEKVKAILISDSNIVLEGLKVVLSKYPNMGLCYLCTSLSEAEWTLRNNPIDLAFFCWKAEKLELIEILRSLRRLAPSLSILCLLDSANQEMVMDCLQAGAKGVQLLRCEPHELFASLKNLLSNEGYLHPSMVSLVLQQLNAPYTKPADDLLNGLSKREMQVLKCLVVGRSNDEIAKELVISLPTVHTHVAHILSKLQVTSRTQAVIYALQHGESF